MYLANAIKYFLSKVCHIFVFHYYIDFKHTCSSSNMTYYGSDPRSHTLNNTMKPQTTLSYLTGHETMW